VLLAGGYFLWSLDIRRGTNLPEYSVQRTDDRGAAVVYRLFQNAGYHPQVWDEDLARLRQPGLLILLAPAQGGGGILQSTTGDLLPPEIQALDKWVAAGNVCVVMTRNDIPLYKALGVFVDEPKSTGGAEIGPVQPGTLAAGVRTVRMGTKFGFKFGEHQSNLEKQLGASAPPSPVPHIPETEWITLFAQKQGPRVVPQVLSAARGRGLYVLVNDIFPAGNLGITQADDAQFMLNMARLNPAGGTIWFDEYHKRSVERGFVSYLRERALAPALVYLLLVLGLLFWRTSVRFGAPEPLVADPRRDSAEYVKAVAALYQNAGMTREALTILYTDLRRRMIGALRLDGLTDLAEVGRRYETRTGRPAREARQVLIEIEAALARPELEEKDALQLAARLTQLDAALHRKKTK
jgi:hypothetical protein